MTRHKYDVTVTLMDGSCISRFIDGSLQGAKKTIASLIHDEALCEAMNDPTVYQFVGARHIAHIKRLY